MVRGPLRGGNPRGPRTPAWPAHPGEATTAYNGRGTGSAGRTNEEPGSRDPGPPNHDFEPNAYGRGTPTSPFALPMPLYLKRCTRLPS